MRYKFEGKTITIPDTELEKSMKLLDISKDEAIQMWLEDNDYPKAPIYQIFCQTKNKADLVKGRFSRQKLKKIRLYSMERLMSTSQKLSQKENESPMLKKKK